jgi:hypothetical protein
MICKNAPSSVLVSEREVSETPAFHQEAEDV